MSAVSLEASLRQALVDARNDDGGWGYARGKGSRLEPTAWALLALGEATRADAVFGAWPQQDGALTEPGAGTVNYAANALASVAGLAGGPAVTGAWLGRTLSGLVAVEGRPTPKGDPAINRQDNTLRGWPWLADTFSWVEPTAWAVLALRRGLARVDRARATSRIDEGIRLLADRMCATGGWNYGNSNVLKKDLAAYVPTTAAGLLALQGREPRVVDRSVGFLDANRLAERSGLALGLTAIALGIHGRPHDDVRGALGEQWARARFLGNLHATAIALYALTGVASNYGAFRV